MNRRFFSLFIFLILLNFISLAYAAENDEIALLETAQTLMVQGEYEQSLLEYQKHVDSSPLAQFSVGLFYQQGWSVKRNNKTACKWFGKAATGLIPTAQYFYAQCLLDGTLERNPQQAAHWFQQAIEGGYFAATCNLGQLHIRGDGVEKNVAKGEAYCYEAAMKSAIDAQLFLGHFYQDGTDTPVNHQASFDWFNIAAQNNHPKAAYHLAHFYRDGIAVPKDISNALHWYEIAASQGMIVAYYETARLYFKQVTASSEQKQEETFLAKAYLWLKATLARETDKQKLEDATKMLSKVEQVMPATWKPELDEKVQKHLDNF